MIKKILVCLDGSNIAELALMKAFDILKGKDQATVLAVRALEFPESSPFFEAVDLQSIRAEERRQVSHYLDAIKEQYVVPLCNVETRILSRSGEQGVPEAIAELAKLEKADLIALTTHGRTGVKKFFFGSVTEKLLRLAPCSVVIVRSASS